MEILLKNCTKAPIDVSVETEIFTPFLSKKCQVLWELCHKTWHGLEIIKVIGLNANWKSITIGVSNILSKDS